MRQIPSVDFAEIEARLGAAVDTMCRVKWCPEPHLRDGKLCFKHEMQYVVKYGCPSDGDARFHHGAGFIHAV